MESSKNPYENNSELKPYSKAEDPKGPLFRNRTDSFYLYSRIERLSAAVLLVADTMPSDSLVKDKIKSLILNLVSRSVLLRDHRAYTAGVISDIENMVLELTSLLDIASISRHISPMNFSILQKEFTSLNSLLGELEGRWGLRGRVEEGIFQYKTLEKVSPELDIHKGHQKDSYYSQPLSQGHIDSQEEPLIKRPSLGGNANHAHSNGNGGRKEAREQAILSIVKEKGKISIKDISKAIKGCSEKTIQRELLALVEKGVLIKEGERRWSRYSIAE